MAQPAPITTSKVMEAVLQGRMASAGSTAEPCGNVFYYRLDLQVVAPTKVAFGNIFNTTVITPLLAAANVRYTPVQSVLRFLDDATDAPVVFAHAGAGAIATDSQQSEDMAVVNLKTAFRSKTMRGYKYFGGVSEIDTTGDVLTGAGLARWQTVRDACALAMVDALGNRWVPFVRSRFLEQVLVNPTTVRGTDINAAILNIRVSNLRSRKSARVV